MPDVYQFSFNALPLAISITLKFIKFTLKYADVKGEYILENIEEFEMQTEISLMESNY